MSMMVRLGKIIHTTYHPGDRFTRAQVDRWNNTGLLTDDGSPYAEGPLRRLLYRNLPDAGLIKLTGRGEWTRLYLPDFDMSDMSFRGGFKRPVGGRHQRAPKTYAGRQARLREDHGDALRRVQGGFCGLCGRQRVDCLADLHVEHLEPISGGGEDGIGNVYAACSTCNQIKHTGTWDEAVDRIEAAGIPVDRKAALKAMKSGLMIGQRVPESWLARPEEQEDAS